MIPLLEKPNVDGADSEYPFGSIRDKTMSQSGTPVNKEVYSDMHQFFMKMMFESGISPNNQFDNEYNGWQLWEAFIYACKNQRNYDRFYVKLTQSSTSAPSVNYQAENDLEVSGTPSYTGVGDYKITFPAGTFPNNTKVFIWVSPLASGYTAHASISGTNVIRIRTYNATGVATDGLLALTDIFVRRYA